MIKILHTADNHLDPRATTYRHKINERRSDFLKAFETLLQYAHDHKPDILLISGDLYDKVNPRNPPRTFLIKHFKKLYAQGTRIFLIGGHHDTPKSVEEGTSPLAELAATGYATFFDTIKDAQFQTVKIGDTEVCISGLTYNFTLQPGQDPLQGAKIPTEGDINILMVHHTIEGFTPTYRMEEPIIRIRNIPKNLDYIAAGHIHRYQVKKYENFTIAYPGSTERKSFAEEGDKEKGFIWLEIDERDHKINVKFIPVPTRPMKTLKINLTESDQNPIQKITIQALQIENKELILRLRISGKLPLDLLSKYRREEIYRELIDKFFAVVIDDNKLEYLPTKIPPTIEKLSPLNAFNKYMDKLIQIEKDERRKKILKLAKELGHKYIEEGGGW